MQNDRPIENPRLRKALREVQQVMARYGLAGACMLVAEHESAFTYGLAAPWSAWRTEPDAPLGVRLFVKTAEDGRETTHARVEGAVHTICQLSDFGTATWHWMEQLKSVVKGAGVEFHHNSFGGNPLPEVVGLSRDEDGVTSIIRPTKEPKQ